jgi:hypothetical protein
MNVETYKTLISNFAKLDQNQVGLSEKLYEFLDENYETYLNATPEQSAEVRSLISGNRPFENSLFDYVVKRVVNQLGTTGKVEWLLRGLVAVSMENSGIDYRDTLTELAELHFLAEEKEINPIPYFKSVANISSHDKPRGGSVPMSEMMGNSYYAALLRERKNRKKSFWDRE